MIRTPTNARRLCVPTDDCRHDMRFAFALQLRSGEELLHSTATRVEVTSNPQLWPLAVNLIPHSNDSIRPFLRSILFFRRKNIPKQEAGIVYVSSCRKLFNFVCVRTHMSSRHKQHEVEACNFWLPSALFLCFARCDTRSAPRRQDAKHGHHLHSRLACSQ